MEALEDRLQSCSRRLIVRLPTRVCYVIITLVRLLRPSLVGDVLGSLSGSCLNFVIVRALLSNTARLSAPAAIV